ncbi:MAG: acyl-CoA dehydrogenase family protein, partial [Candidatus Aminicenantes bacterium]|nr:acyl-CoA dehydrogenase family protein [Candidatus Aminicenantes bacterium]
MNFELNEDQVMLRDLVRDFSRKEIAPRIGVCEEQHTFPREIITQLAGIGILGMTVPPELGGSRTDSLSFILALEELAQVSAAVCIIVSVHASLFCGSILRFGSDLQKQKYLPPAARGEIIGAFSLTEPEAGSDAISLKTKAVRSGEEYILNGTK